jgi:hypothetical protein
MVGETWMGSNEHQRCPYQSLLLVPPNRCCRGRQRAPGTAAYFDEYEYVVVEHNQVDFAEAGSEISGQQPKPVPAQPITGEGFGSAT